MTVLDQTAAAHAQRSTAPRYLPHVFALTICLSAFLLFGVQPMFTKMVLPALGGSPAVWSVAMVFFQTLLLLGYLYAHLSARYLGARPAVIVHALLVAAAFVMLPLTVSQALGAPPDEGQGLWLIGVFSASVGLPFFVLASTAPLLQSWFARSGHPDAGNPYALYVASNIGSFVALLAYPLLVEPLLPLRAQTSGWMMAFALLSAGLATCAAMAVWRALPEESQATNTGTEVAAVAKPAWRQRLHWIALAAVPSGLLVSVTAHLSTDVASAPLLWVLPLAIFMLTFILAFRDKAFIGEGNLEKGFVRMLPFVAMSLVGFTLPLTVQFVIHLGVMFLAAMICHGLLYRTRPDNRHLTEFYLWMSFGGMIGGLFTGLIAPMVFNTIVEYRLLLIAAILCLPITAASPALRPQLVFAAFALAIAVGFSIITPMLRSYDPAGYFMVALAIGVAFLAIVVFNRSGRIASAAALAATFIAMMPIAGEREATVRSFFGVNYVRLSTDGQARLLLHGSTIHGAHRILDLDGKAMTGKPQPTTYYHDDGAINVALRAARTQAGGRLGSVAVLGLGVGAMACQSVPGEKWSFFEIDREVVTLAQRKELFPFVNTCTPDARIIVGDARLTLQKETIKHDVIILDAFSSDAVPAHLLTREAFAIYLQHLAPDGMIIAHVSNRYMDLRSVAEAAGVAHDLATASAAMKVDLKQTKAQIQLATPTTAVAFSRNPAAIEALLSDEVWRRPPPDAASTLWTDDYANILGAMARYTIARWNQPPAP
jgi:hypothetical protein